MALHGMVGALIGHSFVSGLSDHFSHCDRNCTPSKIARNLYVSDSVDEIHLVGASGACILRQEVDWEVLRVIRPTFAILEFGTCDLANGTDALPVADAVMNAAHRIIDDFGVRHVTVCSVLHRTYPHHINADIDAYNNVLRHFCDVETDIDYHTHRGFWQTANESWSRDGLHPNTVIGRRKYKRSLRQAVYNAVRSLKRTA